MAQESVDTYNSRPVLLGKRTVCKLAHHESETLILSLVYVVIITSNYCNNHYCRSQTGAE